MQQTTWGWLIVIYLFLGGLGAGAYLTSALAYKGYFGKIHERFHNFGFCIAPFTVIFGTVLLVFDLAPSAAINPMKILQLYTQPTSIMSLGTYLLTFFIIVSFLTYKKSKKGGEICEKMVTLGSLLAVGVMGYTGLLLYVIKAIPLWNSIWIPILFTVSALSTGASVNAAAVLNNSFSLTTTFKKFHLILVCIEVISVIALFTSISDQEAGFKSIKMITSGSLALTFWVGFVLFGLFLPLVGGGKYLFKSKTQTICECECKEAKGCIFNELGILFGGFCLRVIIVFGAFFVS